MRDQRVADEPPPGQQFQLSAVPWRATVVEAGAGLRTLSADGPDLVDGYSRRVACPGTRGQPLITSPGFALSPARAIDSAAWFRSRRRSCREQSERHVLMGASAGGSDSLDVSVEYRLGDSGLTVCTTATNLTPSTCLLGAAHQPYLKFGARVDTCRLRVPAGRYLQTDPHCVTLTTLGVRRSEFNFTTATPIGRRRLDVTFTELQRDVEGRGWVWLFDPCDRTTGLWIDEGYPFVQVYTSHTQAPPHFRTALGVMPSTCARGAQRSGEGLLMLAPGESTRATWGITAPSP